MAIKLKKMDNRYNGSSHFIMLADGFGSKWNPESIRHYHEVRDWCMESFGRSVDIDYYSVIKELEESLLSTRWAYSDSNRRIFLNNDKDIMLFKLRWT